MLFEKELVLDILYVIAQEMEARENAQYNLLMMELLNHLLRNQDPTVVARSTMAKPPAAAKQVKSKTPKPGSLTAQLQREKQKMRPPITSRHSHFGGTLVVNRSDGKRQYMSATLVENGAAAQPAAQKRKNRKTDPFIGSGRTHACHTRMSTEEGQTKAQRTLNTFCARFVKDCYGPLMKSLKNEFRRDSVRLEEGDKVVFFRIIWFFSQWWRVSGRKVQESSTAVGQLIFTMDVFTFNLVLNATDTFQQHKKYTQLAQAVSLYNEMMQLLQIMYHSKDSTENVMALGLLDRLFYGSEPLDRLPKLLSKWTAGTLTREFACDLVELVHVTLKLLEANSATVPDQPDSKKAAKNDAVARMKQTAAEFDLTSYIVRKIISNQVIFMYTHVLSQYPINAPHVNHHIVAFFLRLFKVHIVLGDDDEPNGEIPTNPLAVKPATLEPMLYNIQLFVVLDRVLNDATIRKEKEYSALVAFATSLMSRFANHSRENQLAFVECLFRHPVPHRFCELTTNLYVNEELRMLAERELLLEEHRRLAEAEGEAHDEAEEALFSRHSTRTSSRMGTQCSPTQTQADDDDDEEVEWDDGETGKAKDAKSRKADASDAESKGDASDAGKENEENSSDGAKEADASDTENDEGDSTPDDEKEVVAMDAEKDGDASDAEKDRDKARVDKDDREKDPIVSKRKLLSDIDGNAPRASPEKKARIQKHVGDGKSSDEELEFETQPPPGAPTAGEESKKRSRLVIDDDDDEED